ncbi:regulatory protein RecX [Granulicoccus phenolivorans]|uniref:regulatory protein RecX n=1 Tax=Granulicoccus phenolivorans TaxID=266854 RepID=UPI00040CA264|nr:regulatory protein RecX [Granulicoccus phenolivorans]
MSSRSDRGESAQADSGPTDFEELERAREVVLQQLSLRARTRSELAAVLQRKGITPEVAAQLLDRFEEVGLVDDADFAAGWVTSRQQRRNLSRRALTQELRRKGVETEVIDSAVAAVSTDDEYAAALDLARRKLRSMHALAEPVIQRRLAGALARRGFSAETTRRAVAEAMAEAGPVAGSEPTEAGPSDAEEADWADDLP